MNFEHRGPLPGAQGPNANNRPPTSELWGQWGPDDEDTQPQAGVSVPYPTTSSPAGEQQGEPSQQQAVNSQVRLAECRVELAMTDCHYSQRDRQNAQDAQHCDDEGRLSAHGEHEQSCQEQIEMLLHGERPCLFDRGSEVVLNLQEILPKKIRARMMSHDQMK